MPIEVLNNNNQSENNASTIFSEIVSQNQRYILGAKLENADFHFIPTTDTQTFAQLPEGAFFTDTDSSGLNRVGRKIGGVRKYLAYEQELRAYVTAEVAKLKPIAVDPATDPTFPVSTATRPISAGQQIVFLSAGTVAGQAVEAGGVAVATSDVAVGSRPTWQQLIYNGTGIQITPINFRSSVRLDGSASTTQGVTEKGIADALTSAKAELLTRFSTIDGRLAQNESLDAVQNLKINELKAAPTWAEEMIFVGNGTNQVFKIALQNRYLNPPQLIWYMLMGSKYVRINDQDGDVITENNVQYLSAAFAGVPASSQFKVSVQGLAPSERVSLAV
jgi:hypothetical protein